MDKAWDAVAYYVAKGVHKRTGERLSEVTQASRVEHLLSEVTELMLAPHDLKEMADIGAILFHHVQAEGYTKEQFVQCILAKLEERVEIVEPPPPPKIWEGKP